MELSSYFDAMSKAKKEYSRNLEPVCRDFGLTQSELAVLLFLRNNPSLDRAATPPTDSPSPPGVTIP